MKEGIKNKFYNEKNGLNRAQLLKSELSSEWEIALSKVVKKGEPLFFIELENYKKNIYGSEIEYENGKIVFLVSTDKDEFSSTGETVNEAFLHLKENIEKNIEKSESLLKLLNN